MTVEGLLSVLLGADIYWTALGNRLRVDAPRGILVPGIRQTIQEHKLVLLDLARRRLPPGYAHGDWSKRLRAFADRFEARTAERAREVRGWAGEPADTDPMDLPPDWRVEWEERAAIREHEGGQAREHAEAEALREIIERMEAADR